MTMTTTLRFALLGGLAMGLAAPTQPWAQTSATPTPVVPVTPTTPGAPPVVTGPGSPATTATPRTDLGRTGATRTDADDRKVVDAAVLEEGANSFTEGQTRSRLEDAGFSAVEVLRKDDRGFWRGQAMRNGQVIEVAMDFRGRIAAGPNLATLGRGASTTGAPATPYTYPSTTVPSSPTPSLTGVRPDVSRPDVSRPDGTPGNPPGTAAGRAVDRATGSNITGTTPAPTTPPPANR